MKFILSVLMLVIPSVSYAQFPSCNDGVFPVPTVLVNKTFEFTFIIDPTIKYNGWIVQISGQPQWNMGMGKLLGTCDQSSNHSGWKSYLLRTVKGVPEGNQILSVWGWYYNDKGVRTGGARATFPFISATSLEPIRQSVSNLREVK